MQVRLAVSDLIWGVKSKEAADQLPLEQLERGLRILHAYEKLPNKKLDDRARVLEQITDCIRKYDRSQSEEYETLLLLAMKARSLATERRETRPAC